MAALISRFVDESARRRWKDMVLALAPACRDSWSWTADEQILVWHFSIFQKSRSSLQTRLQHVLFFYPYCCLCFLFTAGCVRLCKKKNPVRKIALVWRPARCWILKGMLGNRRGGHFYVKRPLGPKNSFRMNLKILRRRFKKNGGQVLLLGFQETFFFHLSNLWSNNICCPRGGNHMNILILLVFLICLGTPIFLFSKLFAFRGSDFHRWHRKRDYWVFWNRLKQIWGKCCFRFGALKR